MIRLGCVGAGYLAAGSIAVAANRLPMPREEIALYYLTFSKPEEAQAVANDLLRQKIAVCTNWFPITCAYLWEGEIQQEAETVLIVKARAGVREMIEEVVRRHIDYTQFIGELPLASVNEAFAIWFFNETLSG